MSDMTLVGQRIAKALDEKRIVEVSVAVLTHAEAKAICVEQNLICKYWIQPKVFVFQKPAGKVTTERLTLHPEFRTHVRSQQSDQE